MYLGQCIELGHNALHTAGHYKRQRNMLVFVHNSILNNIAHNLLHALSISLPPSSRLCYAMFCCSALPKIVTNGYKSLNLHYFFTCGHDEVRAWTIMVNHLSYLFLSFIPPPPPSLIQKGTKAPQAAGKIHTDFEKGFIMAEVSINTFLIDSCEAVQVMGVVITACR